MSRYYDMGVEIREYNPDKEDQMRKRRRTNGHSIVGGRPAKGICRHRHRTGFAVANRKNSSPSDCLWPFGAPTAVFAKWSSTPLISKNCRMNRIRWTRTITTDWSNRIPEKRSMKTTLTVEVEYDPAMTDPEGLACAMDRLLETALSTPDIVSEYGNPKMGEFLVAKETASSKIILNISGGVLQDVFSSDPAISVALVNWTPKVPKNIHEERSIMGMHVVLVGNGTQKRTGPAITRGRHAGSGITTGAFGWWSV